MKKRAVVFDIDDILWGCNERVLSQLNISMDKIKEYKISDCDIEESQKSAIVNKYRDVETFKHIKWFDGASSILRIEQSGGEVYICSNCLSEEIKKAKYELAISDTRIFLNVVSEDGLRKEFPDSIEPFIVCDDSPINLANVKAKHKFTIRYPWNESSYAKELLKNDNVQYFNSLNEMCGEIINVLKN